LTPNPILKVLSTLGRHNAPALLMGGQACILYGGAEFSRDIDLVQSKKTQRDKDWPMIRRLLEADYLQRRETASPEDIRGWLAELRTPAYLATLAREHGDLRCSIPGRPWLAAPNLDEDGIAGRLDAEEKAVRQIDREYWAPLKRELESLRRAR
jgi:hypothetical protein